MINLFFSIIAFAISFFDSDSQSQKYALDYCFSQSSCSYNQGCQVLVTKCSGFCNSKQNVREFAECLAECIQDQFNDLKDIELQKFISCTLKEIQIEQGQSESNEQQVAQRKFEFLLKSSLHSGESFQQIRCSRYTLQPELKMLARIKGGSKQITIFKYFESRCDYVVDKLDENNFLDTKFDFKWADYAFQHNFKEFTSGQLLNHLPGLKQLISDKNGLIDTLHSYDANFNNKYQTRSLDIHFETFLFDLDSSTYSPQEQFFFDKVKTGYWLAKDPYGSFGIFKKIVWDKIKCIGIKLFNNVTQIKEAISIAKLSNFTQEEKEQFRMYQVIQKYEEHPFLIQGRKNDLRSYVLIASVDPFVVLFQNGFIRKSIRNFDLEFKDFDEEEALKHLTNRNFQMKSDYYQEEAENLLMSISNFEDYLRSQKLSSEDINSVWKRAKKAVSYSIMAARSRMKNLRRGWFQLIGVDIIFDSSLNSKIIEFNSSPGLYTELEAHRIVVPQMIQSTLDLVIDSHDSKVDLFDFWRDNSGDLGRWQILYNEASEYDFLKEFEKEEQEEKELLNSRQNQKT